MNAKKVYSIVKLVPKGRVTTYKEVGKVLDSKAYRVIGYFLHKNPFISVPCHRVVMSNGFVGGYAKGPLKKIEMLRLEGVQVKNGKVDLKKYLFKEFV